ncbi:hypothetical protein MLD38_016386 [Melastoma candidum]|uniref:Uncharacterized protein n=1 Tax=Melastoma candidum TaxID=119954 RepID=A0ACB9RJ28_9MYRT|nr:hypothetical protein MLD38_016386 [Melastoma candidum]
MAMAAETDSHRVLLDVLQQEPNSSHVSEPETDLLSALPRGIIEIILCYLPLDEAVRTSLVSKRWRHLWKTMPGILFNYKSFPVAEIEEDAWYNELKLVEAVGQVLENHAGIIQKFVICHPNLLFGHTNIDQWMSRLSNFPVREFALCLWRRHDCRYKMHHSLLEWKGLRSLEICNCSIDHLPLTGFKGLKTLHLFSTPMQQERFEYLVKSCPLLEILSYSNPESYFPTLKIEAPHLLCFNFNGVFDKLMVRYADSLTQVYLRMEWSRSDKSKEIPKACTSNLMDFSKCLGNVKILHVKTQFLKYLMHGYVPERLPIPFPNMRAIAIETDPTCQAEFEAILCMIKSFPCLRSLTISFRGTVEDDPEEIANQFVEHKQRRMVQLPEIHQVEVRGFSDRFSELNFLELFLRASPNVMRLWWWTPSRVKGGARERRRWAGCD